MDSEGAVWYFNPTKISSGACPAEKQPGQNFELGDASNNIQRVVGAKSQEEKGV